MGWPAEDEELRPGKGGVECIDFAHLNIDTAHDDDPSTCASNLTTRQLARRTTMAQQNDTIFSTIATNDKFQNFTLLVIVINALWIGVDTEWNHKILVDPVTGKFPLQPTASVVENVFCAYFTFEVAVRFLGFKKKKYCLKDAWFVFDSILVTCMVLETWVMAIVTLIIGGEGNASFLANFSALRLLRLLRLTRMARLMRSVPELMTLVKGMMSAVKSVSYIIIFLLLIMYIFAIVFTSIVGDNENLEPDEETAEHMCGTIGDNMMTLFTNGVLGDNLSFTVQAILDFPNGEGGGTGLFLMWLFFLFFGISSMTLLNMLIGVLCEVITQTATEESEGDMIRELKMCIEDAFDEIDTNGDGRVCEEEWTAIKQNPGVRVQFGAFGVDEDHLDERLDQMQETLFSKSRAHKAGAEMTAAERNKIDGYALQDLIAKVTELRPDKPASVLDIEILKAKGTIRHEQIHKSIHHTEELLGKMLRRRGTPMGPFHVSSIMPQTRSGGPGSSPLEEIPTQFLLHEMKSRAKKLAANTGSVPYALRSPMAPLGDPPVHPGAVAYADIKMLCIDVGS